eukprot:SAG11_NODE_6321_length_1336_cov_1.293215_1_plen_183_part_00
MCTASSCDWHRGRSLQPDSSHPRRRCAPFPVFFFFFLNILQGEVGSAVGQCGKAVHVVARVVGWARFFSLLKNRGNLNPSHFLLACVGTRRQKAALFMNYKRFSTLEEAEEYSRQPAATIFSKTHVEPFTKLVLFLFCAFAALSVLHYAIASTATFFGCTLGTQGNFFCAGAVKMVCLPFCF